MNLTALPALSDNYIWLLDDGRVALVVDPGVAEPVQQALAERRLKLACILVTHHHGDHTGGVAALQAATSAQVYVPARERDRMPVPGQPVQGGDVVPALSLRWRVLDVPGHTAGHVAYVADAVDVGDGAPAPVLFCGDTLFSGGCGRLFEGTPAQMLASLDALAALPGDTRVCAAHEYTLDNLRFAHAVEPGNQPLADWQRHCAQRRAEGLPTLPSRMAVERAVNPFLRSRESGVTQAVRTRAASATDEVAVFAALREWKNGFR